MDDALFDAFGSCQVCGDNEMLTVMPTGYADVKLVCSNCMNKITIEAAPVMPHPARAYLRAVAILILMATLLFVVMMLFS